MCTIQEDPITTGIQQETARLVANLGEMLQDYSLESARIDHPSYVLPTASAILLLLDRALRQCKDGQRAMSAITLLKAYRVCQNLRDVLRGAPCSN